MSDENGADRNGNPAVRPAVFPDEPVRVAVVGLGYWGPNLVRNLRELTQSEVAYVCDLRPDVLKAVARRHPDVMATTDYAVVLDDETVDAVVIATPVSTHRE
ncbi:MAG: Gfo/Idh/MocA family protein, partial [Gaiellaceae bacterium]